MHRISLTDFVDVVSKSGTPKATKVAQIKNRGPYHPATDMYKAMREHIIDVHQKGLPKTRIADVLAKLTDENKINHYPHIIKGYIGWWGNKKLQWFDPPSGSFLHKSIAVSVNPELGLIVNGIPYVIKLHFKADQLTKNRINIVTHLMETTLRDTSEDGSIMAVLDVRNSKLVSLLNFQPSLMHILLAELAYIDTLWENL